MRTVSAAFLGAGVVLLLAFTVPSAPARHPGVPSGVTNPAVYIFDPYGSGASTGIVNVTPKVPAGSGGAVCTQSQAIGVYDDGGSIGVNCIDSFNGTQTAVTATPAAPSTNQSTIYVLQFDAGMPPVPFRIDGYYGVPAPEGIMNAFVYYSTTTKWSLMGWMPMGWNFTTILNVNMANPATGGASPAGVAWGSGSLAARCKSLRFLSTSSSPNNGGGIHSGSSQQMVWRGNTAGAGGWIFWTRWITNTTSPAGRQYVGLQTGTSFIGGSSDPNTITDTVYAGCNAGDLNYSICSNDNSGTATCNTLGSSFPCNTNGAFYDLWLTAAPNASSIEYYMERLDSAASAAGTITSDLPRNTVQLNALVFTNNGPDGGIQTTLDWMGTLVLGNL